MKTSSKSATNFPPQPSLLSTISKPMPSKNLPSLGKSLFSNEKMEKRKKEKSIEEEIMDKEISSLEKTRLNRVFEILCGKDIKNDGNREDDGKGSKEEGSIMAFSAKDVARVVNMLDFPLSKNEIDLMIWEVDENLDLMVDRYEFDLMYKRCIFDKSGLEPKQLFYLVEFLMYDKQERHKITIEDTLELLYVKTKNYGKNTWEDEIHSIFGPDDKKEDGKEKEITYKEFLESQIKKSIEMLKKRELEKKLQKPFNKKEDEY